MIFKTIEVLPQILKCFKISLDSEFILHQPQIAKYANHRVR